MEKKILFISHSACRTGAPLMLLNFLKWVKGYSDISFEILLKFPGELEADFASLAPTKIFFQPQKNTFFSKVRNQLGLKDSKLQKHIKHLLDYYKRSGISLIYSNTITNGEILEVLAALKCPIITHVHELEYWIHQLGAKNLEQVKKHTTHYIAASQAVQRNLTTTYGIPETAIDVVHSFVPIPKSMPGPQVAARIRAELNIPADAFVVLGSGHETWRKGKDLFVQLAAKFRNGLHGRQVHFLWVGGWQNAEHERNILHDVRHLGVTDRVHFTGEVQNPLDYFTAGDIFAMVSREDPFPLVCLEAAALAKPILCFEGAGGMPELVEGDAGRIIPYLDTIAMAETITALAEDTELLTRLGTTAAHKVRERFDLAVGAQRATELIEMVVTNRKGC